MALKKSRPVRLVRPERRSTLELARPGGSTWRAGPPAHTELPPNKRLNRPKLLGPLGDDAELHRGLQREMTALWLIMVVVVFVLRTSFPENVGAQASAAAILVALSGFLGCGPTGWNPWRSCRYF